MRLALTLALFAPSFAFAAGKGPEALIPYVVNFLIFVGLIWFALRGRVSPAWQARRAAIAEAATSAERARRAAEAQLAAAKVRRNNLDQEIAAVARRIEDEAHHEAMAITDDARQRADRVFALAGRSAEREFRSALLTLRRSVAERIISSATTEATKLVTEERDRDLRQAAAEIAASSLAVSSRTGGRL